MLLHDILPTSGIDLISATEDRVSNLADFLSEDHLAGRSPQKSAENLRVADKSPEVKLELLVEPKETPPSKKRNDVKLKPEINDSRSESVKSSRGKLRFHVCHEDETNMSV